ncbi:peptidylprolyl isomerase [Lysobacter sp. FW306-1B-D06B]|uniref:peptidylprolyl isomerase n=1 Tax=Lysobacter sp. FW306-1B-D06B TaxID=3140250 RepID=UPI0031409BC0
MRRLLREPLLHFLILGALLFAIYGWLNRGLSLTRDEVRVDQSRVQLLVTQFERTWQRPPTREELQGLVDDWVRNEILYREGLAQGLDRNDEIVRRRVVQKVTSLTDGMAADVPSQTDLQAWLRDHRDDYRVAASYTFQQIYFDPARHGDALASVIESAAAALRRDPNAPVGDPTLLPAVMRQADTGEVARTFGTDFANALAPLPEGRWAGPVPSGFGLHLVRIQARTPGRVPALAEVREAVERDLLHARSRQAAEAYYDSLRKRYTVKMEADLDRAGAVKATPAPTVPSAGAR